MTSQALRDPRACAPVERVSPEQLVRWALESGAEVVVSTYNEPLITAEWAVAVFKEGKALGLLTGVVSNGNIRQTSPSRFHQLGIPRGRPRKYWALFSLSYRSNMEETQRAKCAARNRIMATDPNSLGIDLEVNRALFAENEGGPTKPPSEAY